MDLLTHDATAVIEQIHLGAVHWVGLSMGGFVGQRLAARRGDLVQSVTLLNTTHTAARLTERAQFVALAAMQQVLSASLLVKLAKPVMFGPAFLCDPASEDAFAEWTRWLKKRNRAIVRKAVLGVGFRELFVDVVSSIAVPKLVIAGAEDTNISVQDAQSLAIAIPRATSKLLADCGHIGCLGQPALVNEALIEFLGATERLHGPRHSGTS